MVHWMIRIRDSKLLQSLKVVKERLVDAYHQKPREFIELLVSKILNIAFIIWIIEIFGLWPIPQPPKGVHAETLNQAIQLIKPTVIGAFALLGLAIMAHGFSVYYEFIHLFDSMIIKVYNYQKFVRDGRRKVSQ